MSPTLTGSSAIWRFEGSDAIEIRDRITFDFYMGLPELQFCSHGYYTDMLELVVVNILA